jgi:hypothetical protein
LLSFWTIGESLAMTCAGADQRPYQMVVRRGDPRQYEGQLLHQLPLVDRTA